MRGRARRGGDRGSATVWSLGAVAVLLTVFAAGLLLGRAEVARHRAGGAADLAALAAADAVTVAPAAKDAAAGGAAWWKTG